VRDAEAARHNAVLYASRALASGVVDEARLQKMGPYLIQQGGAVFHAKWQSENQKLRGIIRDLQQSDRDEARQRAAAFQTEIDEVEAILACLPMDKPSSNN
jgi:tRNA (adenine22-N1)-methyltransferase